MVDIKHTVTHKF